MPVMVTPPTVPEPDPDEHARLAWVWLHAQCAPSTWERFVASVAVRAPQVKEWLS